MQSNKKKPRKGETRKKKFFFKNKNQGNLGYLYKKKKKS